MIKFIERLFKVKEHSSTIRLEILAGLTTFSSMAYILVVNPTILSIGGMNFGAVLVATIIVTTIASIGIGVLGNLPFAAGPGMGVSVYITYSIILTYGGMWQEALAGVMITSIALLVLNYFHLRIKILNAIPKMLIKAIVSGVGLFLIFVALREIGIIKPSIKGFIVVGDLLTLEVALAILGLIIIGVLDFFSIKGSFIIGIVSIWVISLIVGKANYQGIIALPPSLDPSFLKLDFSRFNQWVFWRFTFSIFFVTLFDSSAAIITLKKFLHRQITGKREHLTLYSDAFGSFVGSLIGTGSLAIHLESALGIKVGGKTGLTSVVVGLCFLLCLFFYPLISSIPTFASSPILIILGIMMNKELRYINWKDVTDVIPTLIVIFTMPLTFSIFLGFAYGFISFTIIKLIFGKFKEITPLCLLLSIFFLLQLVLF